MNPCSFGMYAMITLLGQRKLVEEQTTRKLLYRSIRVYMCIYTHTPVWGLAYMERKAFSQRPSARTKDRGRQEFEAKI